MSKQSADLVTTVTYTVHRGHGRSLPIASLPIMIDLNLAVKVEPVSNERWSYIFFSISRVRFDICSTAA